MDVREEDMKGWCWAEKPSAITTELEEAILPDSNPFAEILNKTHKKKIKRGRRRGRGGGGGGGGGGHLSHRLRPVAIRPCTRAPRPPHRGGRDDRRYPKIHRRPKEDDGPLEAAREADPQGRGAGGARGASVPACRSRPRSIKSTSSYRST